MTATDCAIQCRQRAGCKFFIFFQRTVVEEYFNCYMENTTSPSCPEGWKESNFDFYQLRGKYDNLKKFSECYSKAYIYIYCIVYCNFLASKKVFIVFFSNSFNLNSKV